MSRIEILRDLIKSHADGSTAHFAAKIGRSASQVSQWKNGHRRLGDAGARLIKVCLQLPQGYMDGHIDQAVPATTDVTKLPRKHDKAMADLIAILEATDSDGRKLALGAVRAALHGHAISKPNRAK